MNNHQSIRKNYDFLINQIRKHDIWMNETINLIASENKLSPTAEYCLGTDFGNRVAEGWMGERLFPGLKYYDQIEKYGMELVKSMYNAEFVDIRPISGTIANAIVYTAFTSPGDTILTISINSGAHVSMAGGTPKKVFKLNVEYLPFNTSTYNIDIDKSVEIIQQLKPKMIVLGGSVLLFPQPVKEISAIAKKLNAEPEEIKELLINTFPLDPRMINLIDKIKDKYIIVMVSNQLKSWLEKVIDNNNLKSKFKFFVNSYQIGVRKPDKEIFLAALKKSNSKPEETLFIDDANKNIIAAQELGIHGIQFTLYKQFINDFKKFTI